MSNPASTRAFPASVKPTAAFSPSLICVIASLEFAISSILLAIWMKVPSLARGCLPYYESGRR